MIDLTFWENDPTLGGMGYYEEAGRMIGDLKGVKVIVCGPKEYDNEEYLEKTLDRLFVKIKSKPIIVQSANKDGMDGLVDKYAFKHRHIIVRYHPDNNANPGIASHVRNVEMSQSGAKRMIAFWDGHSAHVKHLMQLAKRRKMKLKVIKVRYRKPEAPKLPRQKRRRRK